MAVHTGALPGLAFIRSSSRSGSPWLIAPACLALPGIPSTLTLTLTSETRAASVASLTLAGAPYSHAAQTNPGVMTLTADDSSGLALGWNVTSQSSAFVYSGTSGGANLPAGHFSLVTANAPTAAGRRWR